MSVVAYNTYNNYMTCYGNEEYNDGRCTAKTVRKADTVSGRTSDAALKVSAGDTSDTAGSDTVSITDDAYARQKSGSSDVAKSGRDYLGISRGKNGTFIIHFTDSASVSRTVQRGYITINGVRLELSDEVKKSLTDTDKLAEKNRVNAFMQQVMQHDMEVAQQQADNMSKAFKEEAKAYETAMRIAKGGKVPAKDERKLMEFNPKLYMMAKLQAVLAKKHKKYKSQYDDEDENNQTQTDSDGGEASVSQASAGERHEIQMTVSIENGALKAGEVSEACVSA